MGNRYKLGYLPELDGLRALAVFCVMAVHVGIPRLDGGAIGVDVFFVLSGFLITSLLVQEFDRDGSVSLKNFYIRRILRLMPALVLMVSVYVAGSIVIEDRSHVRGTLTEAAVALSYTENWVRAFDTGWMSDLGHTWSLACEEQFYILWPLLLVFLLKNYRRRVAPVIALMLALASWLDRCWLAFDGVRPERIYNGLDTHADSLMMGCAMGAALASGVYTSRCKALVQRFGQLFGYMGAAGLIVLANQTRWDGEGTEFAGLTMAALFTGIILLDVLFNDQSALRPILKNRLLVWIGSISYGLYLWHYPIYQAMWRFHFRTGTIVTVGSLAALACASASYYAVERPFLRLKARLPKLSQQTQVIQSPE
jgi:peptidoglycan/LPS O-acetylase OafA/YrhL